MKKRRMGLKALTLTAVLLAASVTGGCAGGSSSGTVSEAAGENIRITASGESELPPKEDPGSKNEKLIVKESAGEPSAPDGSISFEDACKLLDKCGMKELYLPQSVSSYEKLYFGTIEYEGEKYYSIYTYVNADGRKVYTGTNYIVAVDGELVAKKHWFGGYTLVSSTSSTDKTQQELFPDTSITPNEALALIAKNESYLGFDHKIEDYIFEFNPELRDANGVTCYRITPKLEYSDHIDLQQNIYVASDGTGGIYRAEDSSAKEFRQLNG